MDELKRELIREYGYCIEQKNKAFDEYILYTDSFGRRELLYACWIKQMLLTQKLLALCAYNVSRETLLVRLEELLEDRFKD